MSKDLLSMADIEAAKNVKLKLPKKVTPVMETPVKTHSIKDTVYIAIITAFVMFTVGAFVGFTKANEIEANKDQAVSAATASILKAQTPQK